MATQLLNLPVNIPWKLIAVSQDMMDTQFCNKLFPFQRRSFLAISAFGPKASTFARRIHILIVSNGCLLDLNNPSFLNSYLKWRDNLWLRKR